MEEKPYPIRSYQNLRVYQCAHVLASDLFWITRRFPSRELHALTGQLRRTARTVPYRVGMSWNERYYRPAFQLHLDEAQSACAQLGLWLHIAHENCYLTDDAHEQLQARKKHLQQMLTRLNDQRIPMLSGGAVQALS